MPAPLASARNAPPRPAEAPSTAGEAKNEVADNDGKNDSDGDGGVLPPQPPQRPQEVGPYSGAEHHLIGLSPQYWAHTPMLIGDVLSLGLVNGVDCVMSATAAPTWQCEVINSRVEQVVEEEEDRLEEERPQTQEWDEIDKEQDAYFSASDGDVAEVNERRGAAASASSAAGRKRRWAESTVSNEDGTNDATVVNHLVPVSRCTLLGTVVNIERRSTGSTLFLLDDGTGLIDCVVWEDDGGSYALPDLVESPYGRGGECTWGGGGGGARYRVGDVVRIRGKIKCVSVGARTRTVLVEMGAGMGGIGKGPRRRRRYDIPSDVVREINVSTIERTLEYGAARGNSGLDCEAVHWLECVQFGRRVGLLLRGECNCNHDVEASHSDVGGIHHGNDFNSTGDDKNDDENSTHDIHDEDYARTRRECTEPILNGADVLNLLGPDIAARVAAGGTTMMMTAEDDGDDYGARRLFGPDCPCATLPHRDALLYCHCTATSEPLDPCQTFRDALLAKLLAMEGALSPSSPERPGGGTYTDDDSAGEIQPLQFRYKDLLNDKDLVAIASNVVSGTSTATCCDNGGNPTANAGCRRVYINTFRALREDGIIFLADAESDTYHLISRGRVLEPYLAKLSDTKGASALERSVRKENPPAYLSKVPPGRLRVIMKSIAGKRRKANAS